MSHDRPTMETASQQPSTSAVVRTARNVASESQSQAVVATGRPPLYPVVWRWHFYAGLFVSPLFLLVTLTGAIYVFRTELTAIRDRSLQVVPLSPDRLSYSQLRELAQSSSAPHAVEGITVFGDPRRSVVFESHLESEGPSSPPRHLLTYVNPYSGEILGRRIAEDDFFAIVLQLHRNLLLGKTGRWITELSTSWGLLLLATGLYLWWPRGKKNVGVWIPRLTGTLYPVLRDIHAVAGFYLIPLAFLLIGTGLFFTSVWGSGFNSTVKQAGHWAPTWFAPAVSGPHAKDAQPAPLDSVIETVLTQSRPGDSAHMELVLKPDDAYKAWLIQDENKNSYRMVNVDQYSSQLLARVDAQEVPPLYRVRLLAVSIHMGQIFGMSTKILSMLTSLGLMALVVTGIWMWWQRRPRGRTGFPRHPPSRSVPWWGWLIVITCAVTLPVAGISMLLVGAMEVVWMRVRRA